MHTCPYRLTENQFKCQIHIDNGFKDLTINEGICEKCLFYQNHKVTIEKASLSMVKNYIESHLKYIKMFKRQEANKLFDKIFNYSTKMHEKSVAIEYLSNILIRFSENPYIKEEDIERAFNEFRRFEENT